jgi:hypothetical protein
MKLTDLLLNRFLYKDNLQNLETKDSSYNAGNVVEETPPPLASGGAAQDINISNVSVNGSQLNGPIPQSTLDISNLGWTNTCIFSITDLDTVEWTSGVFTSANGVSYSIPAGNTGNMSAKNYIYFNLATSTYISTPTITNAFGIGKVLIATAQNGASSATFALVQASQIVGDNIAVNTINANRIVTGSISTTQLSATAIDGMTITGTLIQTSSTGERIVLDGIGTNNSLQVYDADGQVIGIGTDAGRAINLSLTSSTNNGIVVSSSVAGNGFNYTNSSNVSGRGILITQSNNGSDNNLPCIEVRHDGHYYAQLIDSTHEAGGIYIGNAGTLASLYLNHSATGSNKGIDMYYAGTGNGLSIISSSTSQNSPHIYFEKNGGVNENVHIYSVANSASRIIALKLEADNAGAGAEYAIEFAGSANTIWSNAAVSGSQDYKIKIYVDGVARYIPCYSA